MIFSGKGLGSGFDAFMEDWHMEVQDHCKGKPKGKDPRSAGTLRMCVHSELTVFFVASDGWVLFRMGLGQSFLFFHFLQNPKSIC